MRIYIKNTPLEEATTRWFERIGETSGRSDETVPVSRSLGRISAEPVTAEISSPFYHSSAMDGYAVGFEDTFGASETNPVLLGIPEKAVYLNTGDPVPEGFSSVIKIEETNIVENEKGRFLEIISPVTPWRNVRLTGEDIVATELIIPENHKIRPVDIAAMLAGGRTLVKVKKIPIVGIIPTGDEIVDSGTELKKGDIIDTNSWMLSGLLTESCARTCRYPIVPDKKEMLRGAIDKAVEESDMVLVIAGSSAGTEDFTSEVIGEMGEIVVHGVNIKPGKPVILGMIREKPVIGIPGYPVSAFLAFRLFCKPVLDEFYGAGITAPDMIPAKLSRQISSPLGVEEFVRMKLGSVSGKIIATPVGRGAGLVMSLVRTDGLLRVPAMSEGYGPGSKVNIELLKDRSEIENTIVCIGSHDNSLDIIANSLKKKHPLFSLSSAHVGSMGGIMAIRNGEAHIAGIHLFDEAEGEYNVPFIRKFLTGRKLKLVNLVYREQGLIVPKGNPKSVKGIGDLVRDDIFFINRQAGAGTRLLTDKCLRDFGIAPEQVKGYGKVEFTHMAVASAVKSGVADTGMGIYSSAVALGLDFIPVANERYDLIIPGEFENDEKIGVLLDIIRNDMEFRALVVGLGGYDVSDLGKVVYEQ